MELNEFITKTLTDVSKGVWDAQRDCVSNGTFINPSSAESVNCAQDSTGRNLPITVIEFEVGLTIAENSKNSFSIGVVSGAIGLGGKRQNSNENKSITSIKFSIPVALPTIATSNLIQKTTG